MSNQELRQESFTQTNMLKKIIASSAIVLAGVSIGVHYGEDIIDAASNIDIAMDLGFPDKIDPLNVTS